MFSNEQTPTSAAYCLLCYSTEKLSRCSRCGTAYYCSKDHQIQHWKVHRKYCKVSVKGGPSSISVPDVALPSTSTVNEVNKILNLPTENLAANFAADVQEPTYSGWLGSNIEKTSQILPTVQEITYPSEQLNPNLYVPSECTLPDTLQNTALYEASETSDLDSFYAAATSGLEDKMLAENNVDTFLSLSSELLSSTNNYWDLIDDCNSENFMLNYNLGLSNTKPLDERIIQTPDNLNFVPTESPTKATVNTAKNNNLTDENLLLKEICLNVVHDLNEFGICVIDDFLGSKIGDLISAEVKSMFLTGMFKKGEVVSSSAWHSNQNIRGDVITWVDGSESGCHYIGTLIKKLDFIMASCNKMPQNGILSKYKLNRRTKAMIACYPGDGTHYKKHIDNPNGDGRCITCIYYLNKKWDAETHGGILQMFPVGRENEVANIEPIFDRMLFFWSDKRNPHEVLPSYAIRFAITVWYFDSDERDKALQKGRTHSTK